MLIPNTEADAAYVIRNAAADRKPLAICGNNTRGFSRANQPAEPISSRGLTGIVDYDPAEMVMTVRSGTPVSEVETALAANRQMMAFEPMDHRGILATKGEPTIGGVFAANVSGPRRFTAGAARDSLLGLRFVNGRGEIIRAGGRVMKNVTGLDLTKLLAGSRGTLGFITEVTFRVLPVPPAVETVVISSLDDEMAAKAMAAAVALPVEISGAAHLPASVRSRFINGRLPDGEATVLRLEGLGPSIEVRAQKLAAVMEAFGPVATLGMERSLTLWREIRNVVPYADGTEKPLWRVSVAPSAGYHLVSALRLEAGIDAFYDWQGGLVWMRMEADPEAELVRRYIRALGGGHATLIRASEAAHAEIPTFEPLPDAIAALSARVKEKLDPAGIFCSGKMGG
ncbi:2-hydroxy-acid oxidase [Rhizobium wenxiniae]|uniref:Glycolate oxidase FAD binding subunit n=1 Tax=Rhizobium wenxiniae TaxID=1737357 RepID=A0A7W9Y625_9HYPH|nr:FAD-binding protein [Rhizobium wenxiniae]MBB6162650.1 glycolate oxidase FAD binding subunit [Rhizobium wenxiniae]GGF96993.1 2-hydroxy-acid oxidase [Rhizobium wenxiniae]